MNNETGTTQETHSSSKKDRLGRFLAILCTVLLVFAGLPSIAIGEDAEEPAAIETETSLDEEALKKVPAAEEEAEKVLDSATEIEAPVEPPAYASDVEAPIEAEVSLERMVDETDSPEYEIDEMSIEPVDAVGTSYVVITQINLSPGSKSAYPGEIFNVFASFALSSPEQGSGAIANVEWGSSNERVASVSAMRGSPSATVTALSAGNATIWAMTTDGSNIRGTCSVTVTEIFPASVSLSPGSMSLKPGDTQAFTATVNPPNTTDKSVEWSSSNTNVATVDSEGLVTAKAVGTSTISVKTLRGTPITKNANVTVTPITAESLTLSSTSETLKVGKKVKLVATVNPANTANKNVTWKSSDDGIATVASDGTVTAKSVGTATITATTADGSKKTAECEVTVEPIISESVSVSPTEVTLKPRKTKTLTATVSPDDATNKDVEWESSDENVAIVDSDGTVTAKSVGTAVITATTVDGSEKTASCTITVEPIKVTEVTLSSTAMNLMLGDIVKLGTTVSPNNATDKSVLWSSDNQDVASVGSDGTVTANGVGTANITATAADGSGKAATCTIRVKPIPVTNIWWSSRAEKLRPGDTVKLSVALLPDNATNKSVTWSSSDEKVAIVGSDGTVAAKGVGKTTITATAGGLSVSCVITVEAVTATEISVSVTTCSLKVGESVEVGASLEPPDVTDRGVTWATSDEKVVTVKPMDATARSVTAASAIVTAVGPGKATVMAVPDDGSPISAVCEIEVAEQPAAPDPGTGSTTDSTPGANSDSGSGSSSPTTVETNHAFAVASTTEPKAPEQEAAEPEGQRLVWTAGTPTKTTEAIPLVRTGDALFLVGASAFVLLVAAAVIIARRRPA